MATELDVAAEAAKAVQEVAKAAGGTVEAGRAVGRYLGTMLAGSVEQIVGIWEDKLKYRRWESQVKLLQKAEQMRVDAGMHGKPIPLPLKLAVPLLEGASIEDDDSLLDRWAALLVNSTSSENKVDLQTVYIDILSGLSPLEAKILDAVYSLPFEATQHGGIFAGPLPGRAIAIPEKTESSTYDEMGDPDTPVKIALSSLSRSGCLRLGMTWRGGESFSRVNPTVLGRAFVEACRSPTRAN
ncbi:DUF4393 domain-containing protein [Variovorax atrisoli]|uniref:Abi-alpha family protein n=1 Tax=Variovorax atrisoli TaxID=3394203 RepID=UPI000F7EDE14|nr:Abi-alpha family protein [Variovorax sp. 369]RTD84039.1 DUF4393 domain-containing protein [Variovorax sp. 369]